MTKGERIRNLREKIGKSQVDFADMIGVTKQLLYKYENDIITNIPSDKIEAIASKTGVSPSYIMGWQQQLFAESSTTPDLSPDAEALLSDYEKLNDLGKKRARDDVADLTQIPKYQVSECRKVYDYNRTLSVVAEEGINYGAPIAAHEHPDATPEEVANDDDIMDDDSRWKK